METIPFEIGWGVIKNDGIDVALARLDKNDPVVLSTEELSRFYSISYQMCTQDIPHNWSGKLYYTILDEMQMICEKIVQPKLAHARDGEILDVFIREWEKHLRLIKCCRGMLGYIDRFYVKRLALLTLEGLAIKSFHDFVFEPLKARLIAAFLKCVENDRKSPNTNAENEKLAKVVDIYVAVGQSSLQVYEDELEAPLLVQTEQYMRKQANAWIASSTCPEYLRKVQAQLNAENRRVDNYLHDGSRTKLNKVCDKQLISEHLEPLLNMKDSGCKYLLEKDEDDVLELMFVLLRRVPNGLAPMAVIFRKFLQNLGGDKLANPQYSNQWNNNLDDTLIPKLVEMHQKYRAVVRNRFAEHNTFHRAFKEAFEYFINLPLPPEEETPDEDEKEDEEEQKQDGRLENGDENTNPKKQKKKVPKRRSRTDEITISELLSDFIDRKLRKNPSDMAPKSPDQNHPGGHVPSLTPRGETMLERYLVSVVELFGYVNDKDVFGQFYRKHLAKRLILNRSTSFDAEQVVISKLQQICGNPFVAKYTGMIKDLLLARELQKSFSDHCEEHGQKDGEDPVLETPPFDINVKVLTSGFWPSYKNEIIENLPRPLQLATEKFEAFYASRTAHRVVTWIHALGTLVVTGVMKNGKKVDINANTFQGCILLLFNQSLDAPLPQDNNDTASLKLTQQEMATKLGVSIEIIKKNVYSLAKGKYRLLRQAQNPTTNEMEFSINWDFETKHRRIKIPMLPEAKSAEAKADRSSNLLKISEERRYAVEAAIVRIMKAHQRLTRAELSAKVIETLNKIFQPQPKTINDRIKDLLERDYIEPDSSDEKYLLYVA